MRNDDDRALRDIERTQAELKRNIEDSTKLIDRAQDAIARFRRETDEPAKPA